MSKRILIIEDEESIADLERDYLELSNFEVEVANDGEIGLKQAMEADFDLIIPAWMDLRSAGRSATARIPRSSWFPQRRMTSIRSGGLAWEPTTI